MSIEQEQLMFCILKANFERIEESKIHWTEELPGRRKKERAQRWSSWSEGEHGEDWSERQMQSHWKNITDRKSKSLLPITLLHKQDLVSLHKKCSLLKNIMKGDQMDLLDINQIILQHAVTNLLSEERYVVTLSGT